MWLTRAQQVAHACIGSAPSGHRKADFLDAAQTITPPHHVQLRWRYTHARRARREPFGIAADDS